VLEEEKANRAKENEEKYRTQVLTIKGEIEKEAKEKERITAMMAADIRHNEERMMAELKTLEDIVKTLEEDSSNAALTFAEKMDEEITTLQNTTEEELLRKDAEIRQLNSNMEMMSTEFMGMLKAPLPSHVLEHLGQDEVAN
jgi:hypothetical protein